MLTNAVVNKGAVVVKNRYTVVAFPTVRSASWTQDLAGLTEFLVLKFLLPHYPSYLFYIFKLKIPILPELVFIQNRLPRDDSWLSKCCQNQKETSRGKHVNKKQRDQI